MTKRLRIVKKKKGRLEGVYRPTRKEFAKLASVEAYLRNVVSGILHEQGVEEPDSFSLVYNKVGEPREIAFTTESA